MLDKRKKYLKKEQFQTKRKEELFQIEAKIDYFLKKWGWNLSDLEGEY